MGQKWYYSAKLFWETDTNLEVRMGTFLFLLLVFSLDLS